MPIHLEPIKANRQADSAATAAAGRVDGEPGSARQRAPSRPGPAAAGRGRSESARAPRKPRHIRWYSLGRTHSFPRRRQSLAVRAGPARHAKAPAPTPGLERSPPAGAWRQARPFMGRFRECPRDGLAVPRRARPGRAVRPAVRTGRAVSARAGSPAWAGSLIKGGQSGRQSGLGGQSRQGRAVRPARPRLPPSSRSPPPPPPPAARGQEPCWARCSLTGARAGQDRFRGPGGDA